MLCLHLLLSGGSAKRISSAADEGIIRGPGKLPVHFEVEYVLQLESLRDQLSRELLVHQPGCRGHFLLPGILLGLRWLLMLLLLLGSIGQ